MRKNFEVPSLEVKNLSLRSEIMTVLASAQQTQERKTTLIVDNVTSPDEDDKYNYWTTK